MSASTSSSSFTRSRKDSDGNLEFIGESISDHTPKDEAVRAYTGNSFDLNGEHKHTNYVIDTAKDYLDESFKITSAITKRSRSRFTVVERLYRGLNWRITHESHPHKKTESQRMEYQVR